MRKTLMSRKTPMLLFVLIFTICMILAGSGVAIATSDSQESRITTAEAAWEELMGGNQRFVAGERADRDFPGSRVDLIEGQHPFATIITCSDSRVPPELLFDQGLGDVFIIRNAGNVVDGIELGSIEYGVHHLHTPVLVVLGHQSCGAVTAAVEGGAEGNIGIIMEEINPAVETARKTNKTGEELVEEAVDENMRLVIENILAKSPVTKELVDNGELTIVGAKYFFDTGEVKVVEVMPEGSISTLTQTLNESAPPSRGAAYERPEITTGEAALEELMGGNQRFVAGERADRDFPGSRVDLIEGQHPFATIITCSDSRVPPELLFDQGLGDVFIIRNAGNVVDGIELGSIEYGVHHLHTPVLVVLGHQSCGAVTAAVEGGAEGNIGIIMEEINPAVETARKTNKTGEELVEEAVDENMRLVIENILAKSPVTKELVDNGELTIVGAKYFFDTGEVKVVEERAAASTEEVADNDEEAVHETATPEDATATQDTPGFGAFAALSALGALAAILYRKRG